MRPPSGFGGWLDDGVAFSCDAWGNGPACCAKAGAMAAVVHGEILNREALSLDLGLPAATDTATLLLEGWRHLAIGVLGRLEGVFAVVVRDGDELILHRDPSGLRSLHCYVSAGPRIAFATDLHTLLQLPGCERRLARRSLHEYLRFLDIAAPNTLFERVQAVEAGQTLLWRCGQLAPIALANPDDRAGAPASLAEAVATLDAHLVRTVQGHLTDLARPASFLSAGIDSTLLCAIAARQRPDVTAVTVGFDDPSMDEAPFAQRIAAHLGMGHAVLRFSQAEYRAAFERLANELDQPMADPATPATVLAFDYCRSRFDGVLDGTGADEAVGTMPPRHVRLAVGWASLLPRPLRHTLARAAHATPALAPYAPVVDFVHPADTMIRWQGFEQHEIEALCGEPVSFEHTRFYQTFTRFHRRAHFERYSALHDAMPCDRLTQSMLMTGLTVRFPFCDAQTNRFLRRLEVDHRWRGREPKRLLRVLLSRYVAPQMWDNPKRGFSFPLRDFLAADGFALVREYLDGDEWQRRGLLAHHRVVDYASRFIAGEQRLSFRIWLLCLLGAWLRRHGEPH